MFNDLSTATVNHLTREYERLLKSFPLLYGYGLVVYMYSHTQRKMMRIIELGGDKLVKDLERFIPSLAGKAIITMNQAGIFGRTAIIPKDMISGETYLTVAMPDNSYIFGFKGGNTKTNHEFIEDMVQAMARLGDHSGHIVLDFFSGVPANIPAPAAAV